MWIAQSVNEDDQDREVEQVAKKVCKKIAQETVEGASLVIKGPYLIANKSDYCPKNIKTGHRNLMLKAKVSNGQVDTKDREIVDQAEDYVTNELLDFSR